MTGRDLISGALRLIGVLASGESLTANESTDGLSSLNDMLDSWSNEDLIIPNKVREVFALTAGQQSYTMGPNANFNTTRPMRIETALIQLTGTSPLIELPMHILTKEQYAGILLKTVQSTFPLYIYPEGTNPNETINVWPVPNAQNSIVLYSWKPLANVATIGSTISLPQGYNRALRFNLACELAPEYGRAIPELVMQTAIEAKAAVKRMNFRPSYLRLDDPLIAKPAVWNWMTGEPT